MGRNRGVNVWIWAASLALYWWIKGGGAEAELSQARALAAERWQEIAQVD